MSEKLEKLLRVARDAHMTPEQQEQQRRSFAFGNTSIANSRITREAIDRAAESMSEDDPQAGGRGMSLEEAVEAYSEAPPTTNQQG